MADNPLDYEPVTLTKKTREWWNPVSGGLCIIGGGLVAIAGSIIVAADSNDTVFVGAIVLLAALVLIIIGLVRWT